MAENFVENGLELGNYLVDRHWDKGWDKYRKFVNGKKVKSVYQPVEDRKDERAREAAPSSSSSSSSSSNNRDGLRSATEVPQGRSLPVRSSDFGGGAALTGLPALLNDRFEEATAVRNEDLRSSSTVEARRRRQRNQLPSPDRDVSKEQTRATVSVLDREVRHSDQVLRSYEAETDDPKRNPASVLPPKYLWTLDETPTPASKQISIRGPATKRDSILKGSTTSRRDSGIMASGYNDNYYGNTQYQGEGRARSAQPPRSRYYDDDDSDYDERSGKRSSGRGRGYDDRYDDRDYDRVVEETERYRGPPLDRPLGERRESYRSGNDPYGAGAVTQYGRRSDGALDRTGDRESYVSRRSKSRGRSDRDRSYSGSRSRSRSRDRDRGEGIAGKIQDQFDTSTRGLGVGLAGAVIGGLAGRHFGANSRHHQRDIILGAVVGGLGANLAENKYSEWRNEKREKEERTEERWEQKWDARDGRSRSNVR